MNSETHGRREGPGIGWGRVGPRDVWAVVRILTFTQLLNQKTAMSLITRRFILAHLFLPGSKFGRPHGGFRATLSFHCKCAWPLSECAHRRGEKQAQQPPVLKKVKINLGDVSQHPKTN